MSKGRLTVVLLILVSAGLLLLLLRPEAAADTKRLLESTYQQPSSTHPLRFYEERAFMQGVHLTQGKMPVVKYHIKGGILPHHLLPGFMLSDFFSRLGNQAPSTIILIGPNHYEAGHYPALSSIRGWETPFGVAQPNRAIIDDLLEHKLVQIDEEAVSDDHSTAGSMPYIRYYVPSAQVVPIILSGKMHEDEVQRLADRLATYLDNQTVLIAPVDFSHYLTAAEAEVRDRETLNAMQEFNYQRLLSMGNDNVDSPNSIAVLLKAMQKLGTTESDLLQHTNSGILAKDPTMQTTSYFSILYH